MDMMDDRVIDAEYEVEAAERALEIHRFVCGNDRRTEQLEEKVVEAINRLFEVKHNAREESK